MDDRLTQMFDAADAVCAQAYAPYSNFRVGCCVQGANGELYVGCNVENASYGLTMCAEASALSAMISDGCYQLQSAVVVQAEGKLCLPCGACRQRLWEHRMSDTMVHVGKGHNNYQSFRLDQLLPAAFDLVCEQ